MTLQAAIARHRAGDLDAAIALYKKVLVETPEQPDALHLLGVIAQQRGNSALALKLVDAALGKKPDMAMAWRNRATILRTLGRRDEALAAAQESVRLDPTLAEGWDSLGCLLREMKRLEESAAHHAHAVALQPDNPTFQNNYAVLLAAQGHLDAARQAAERAAKTNPALAANTLGHIWKALGHPEQAVRHFEHARLHGPTPTDSAVNEALARLQMGDMEKGLALWEQRADTETRFAVMPRWRGEKSAHLLVHETQGLGDAIQCLRFVPLLRDRAERITLQLANPLHRLAQDSFPFASVVTLEDTIPDVTARVQLMSLPAIFNARLENLPAPPYLKTRADERASWRERLAGIPAPRLGLVWEGNRDNPVNAARSVPLTALQPLFDRYGTHIVSLQKGPAESALPPTLFNAAPHLPDLAATAALMEELDLVLTMCSAPAHLAGGLGCKGFVMLGFDPHWTWLRAAPQSPWYPTLRLFRQPTRGDWGTVVQEVIAAIGKSF